MTEERSHPEGRELGAPPAGATSDTSEAHAEALSSGVVVLHYRGPCHLETVLSGLNGVLERNRSDRRLRIVANLTEADVTTLQDRDLIAISEWFLQRRNRVDSRRAIVVSDAHSATVVRLHDIYERMKANTDMGIFHEVDEAVAWLESLS